VPERPSRARSRREFLPQAGEDGVVGLRVVDLVSRALSSVRRGSSGGQTRRAYLGAGVDAQESNSSAKLGKHVVGMLRNVGLSCQLHSVTRLRRHLPQTLARRCSWARSSRDGQRPPWPGWGRRPGPPRPRQTERHPTCKWRRAAGGGAGTTSSTCGRCRRCPGRHRTS